MGPCRHSLCTNTRKRPLMSLVHFRPVGLFFFFADVVVCHGHLVRLFYLQTPRQRLRSNVIPRGNICWPVRADLLVSATTIIRILRVWVDVRPGESNTSPLKSHLTCCVEAIEIAQTLALFLFRLTSPCMWLFQHSSCKAMISNRHGT